uniref:Cystinosin n=1 Tax=Callorhinchus milii TaxID=7868 RepID=A0A4W3JUE5_CALMI|eukprot:gi/632966018/ref/XP_007899186.1/ PREDICTED: cystinosin [Callorhinchus milii]
MKLPIFLLFSIYCLSSNSLLQCDAVLTLSAPEFVSLQIGNVQNISIAPRVPLQKNLVVTFNVTFASKHGSIVQLPEHVVLPSNSVSSTFFPVKGLQVGQAIVYLQNTDNNLTSSLGRIRFLVVKSDVLTIINQVIGWIYFLAWSISFYPQIFENWKRKSVVGLNFDYLALNLMGHTAYGVFNIGLFWIPYIKKQFLENNLNGVDPVYANDVFFSLHAILLTAITACQCCIYEKGVQEVSKAAIGMLVACVLFALVTLFVTIAGELTWLQYFYYFSYIKLGVTLIKYIPQAYMNYQRKSTVGWSIGNVLLDFTGGSFSLLQMVLQSYNNGEWKLIFGDPTKFGLGLFSMMFDVLFMVQHYCLYRNNLGGYEELT